VKTPEGLSNLAPLTKYDPKRIVPENGDDQLAQFVLALALAFNDLKGLLFWRENHFAIKPQNLEEVSEEVGEWTGVLIQIHRLLAGYTHELLELIKTFESVAVGEPVKKMMKKAHPSTRHHWDDLVKIATGKGTPRDKAFAKVLVEIRNNASYHYYQPKALVAGFRRYFFESPLSPGNETAYGSMGSNMARSRFYFADAAMLQTFEDLAKKRMDSLKFSERLSDITESVNQALFHVVSRYIAQAKLP